VKVEAARRLLAPREDVWALLAEPYHLSDWWPGYTAIRPDRRGFAAGARWTVVRSASPGLLRRPGGEGLIVIESVDPTLGLAWRDLEQHFRAEIAVASSGGETDARVTLEAPWWRVLVEGLRSAPQQALARLHALCQTADSLARERQNLG
jgi:Polyketide cyclase / dehydrase and lipid transport